MTNELKQKISDLYDMIFFNDGFANKVTGVVNNTNKKVATYPYIGDKYGKSKKILVVGLDLGQDETPGSIQSLVDRNSSLKSVHNKMNFHMGGTYFTALYLLKESLGYNDFYDLTKNETIFNTIIKRHINDLPSENPLDYICLTNFFKYVTVNREDRRGDFDRHNIDPNLREIELFLSEIKILDPEIIFLQSMDFNKESFKSILDKILVDNRQIIIGYHPSKALPKLKYPEYYFKDYCISIN